MTLTRGQAFLEVPGSKPRRGRGLLRSAVLATVFAVALGQATLAVSLAERDQVTPVPPTVFIKGPGPVNLCGIVSAIVAPVIPFGYGIIAIDGQGVVLSPTAAIGSLRFGQMAMITGNIDGFSVLASSGQAVPVDRCPTLTQVIAASPSTSSSVISAPGTTQPAAGSNLTQPATVVGTTGGTTTTTTTTTTTGTGSTTTTTGTGGTTTTTTGTGSTTGTSTTTGTGSTGGTSAPAPAPAAPASGAAGY
jgi:hypothetical protein